jgi:small subunit ribosomal protein S2
MAYYGSAAFPELSLIDLSLEQLVESDFHLGSKLSRFEKLNFKYVFSKRFDVLIVDLTYSLYNLRLAIFFLSVVVSRRGKILFFDNHESTQNFVRFIGVTSKQYYISRKWIAGLLTNFKNFYPAVFSGMSRHFRFSESRYAGMRFIHRPPNVTCLLNIDRGSSAFLENFRLAIPTIALVNLDNHVSGVTFPIYSNNNSIYTHYTFFSVLRSAVLNGYRDEIYKFYRRSIKRRLLIRYKSLISNSYFKSSIFFFLRQYLLRYILLNKEIVYEFFTFLARKMQSRKVGKSDAVVRIVNVFSRDILYFSDKQVMDGTGAFFIQSQYAYHQGQDVTGWSDVDFSMKSCIKFLYIVIDLLFCSDSARFFWFFTNRFFLPFQAVFWTFVNSDLLNRPGDCTKIESKFGQLYNDLPVLRLILNMWLNRATLSRIEFRRHFLFEFTPLLAYGRGSNDLRAPLSAKLFNFRMQYSGYLPYMRFLNFNMLAIWHKEFRTGYSFKSLRFSRMFKSVFRMVTKRIRFAKFLWRALYPKRNPYLYFDLIKARNVVLSRSFVVLNKSKGFFTRRYTAGTTVKNLAHRRLLRDRFNTAMLQYFDEEFEDYPFPVNNEFFFLHAAYGSIFLTRQYHRNKLLIAQRELMHKSVALQKGTSSPLQRLRLTLRNNRIMLYFSFSDRFFKTKF